MLPGGVALTGGGAMLRGVDRLFEELIPHARFRVAEPYVPKMDASGHGFATAIGMAKFMIEAGDDELVAAGGATAWKDKIKSIWSILKP